MSHSDAARTRDAFQRNVDAARLAIRSGDPRMALELYDAAFRLLPAIQDPASASDLLRWTGHVHRMQGTYDVARELYDAALTIAEACDLAPQAASARNDQGHVAHLEGDMDTAERLYRQALDGAQGCGDVRLAAMAEQNLGVLANIRGDVPAALEHYEAALLRYQEVGDDLAASWALNNIGMARVDRGEWEAAGQAFDLALQSAGRVGDAHTVATIELNRAELFIETGELPEARTSCDQAFELFSRLESETGLAETYKVYSALYRETGRTELAEAHLSVMVDVARGCQDTLLEAELQSDRALLQLAEGRSRDALVSLNRAHELFTALRAQREVADLDRRLDRLEERYLTVVQAWGESIEAKDPYTAGHCARVAELTCVVAESLGFEGRDLRWIRMGAFLHDVGKTSVPRDILVKQGPLTPEEREIARGHTTAGDAIVAEVGFPYEIRPIVRSHHERWDGEGYPDGLAGEQIPLLARILTVADIYDALTSDRSYRKALGREEALAIMAGEAGRTVDPALFARFEELVRSPEVTRRLEEIGQDAAAARTS